MRQALGADKQVLGVVLFAQIIWALWIFGRQIPYAPITIEKLILFVAYLALMTCLAYAGAITAYYAIIFTMGE